MQPPVSTPTTPRPHVPVAPAANAPVPVLAEGTAPVAIAYRPARATKKWPFVVGAALVIATGALAYTLHGTREAKRELELRYPIAAAPDETAALESGVARWTKGRTRLLANLGAFDPPALSTLKGVGACPLETRVAIAEPLPADDRDLALSTSRLVGPSEAIGDLADVDQLIASAQRARFRTELGRDHVLELLGSAFVVVRLDEMHGPELDRAHDSIVPGTMSGTAYAYDPATGELRCAGSFRASSTSPASLSSFSGLDHAREAAVRDFHTQVETTIVASLRAID